VRYFETGQPVVRADEGSGCSGEVVICFAVLFGISLRDPTPRGGAGLAAGTFLWLQRSFRVTETGRQSTNLARSFLVSSSFDQIAKRDLLVRQA